MLRGDTLNHDRDPFDRRHGKQGWLKWSAAPWRDGDGNIGGVVIMHEDVTAIVQAQHEVEIVEGAHVVRHDASPR